MSGLVLLVECGRASGDGAGSWLREAGYQVAAPGSGRDCLRTLATTLPDVVVLERTLPDLCGLDVLEAIRRAQPLVPVILTTSDASAETVQSGLLRGAYDYLEKPVDRTELLTTVRNAVACHRMSVRLEQLEHGAEGSFPLVRLEELERLAIENALRHTGGNVSAVVRYLGIGRTTLYRKLKKYGLQHPAPPSP